MLKLSVDQMFTDFQPQLVTSRLPVIKMSDSKDSKVILEEDLENRHTEEDCETSPEKLKLKPD